MTDRQSFAQQMQGWLLSGVCSAIVLACVWLIASGWVPPVWELNTIAIVLATSVLAVGAWKFWPRDKFEKALQSSPGAKSLSLIGCPEHDLAEMPQRFLAVGVTVRPPGVIEEGDSVIFCISCDTGPTPKTLEALKCCSGQSIRPVALVMTQAHVLAENDSLLSMVRMEDSELLCKFLPREIVERLPVYYDFDPGLIRKLLTLTAREPQAVLCRDEYVALRSGV